MEKWVPRFEQYCARGEFADFLPYAEVIRALATRDPVSANAAFQKLIEGHKRQCKGKGDFRREDDQVLCVWGLGLANLCRSCGLPVDAVPPLIPEELLFAN